jgi:NitT/TauT family transport system substrate-binding protein
MTNRRFSSKNVGLAIGALALIVGIAGVVVVLVKPGGGSPPVRVAVMTWAGAGPGFVAIERDMFDDLPVEISVIDDTKARQAAFQSSGFEVYLTNPDQHPREVEMGLPGSMFLLSDISFGADGLIAKREIRTVADLRGKRIAYTQGTASDFMLSKALQSAGLTRDDVVLVELDDPGTAVAALASGQVDAALSWEPLMSQAVAQGQAHILFTSANVPDAIIGVFIAKESLLHDRSRLNRFMQGWLEAVEFIKANPQASYPIIARGLKVQEADVPGMIAGLRLADRAKNREYFTLGADSLTKLDRFVNDAAAYWKSVGLLSRAPNPRQRWVQPEPIQFFSQP